MKKSPGAAARGPLPRHVDDGAQNVPHMSGSRRAAAEKRPEHKRREKGKRISKYGPGYNYPGPAPASVLLLL